MIKKDDPRLSKKNLIRILVLFAAFVIIAAVSAFIFLLIEGKTPGAAGGSTAIRINEIMLSNKGVLVDPAGNLSDWIELYNDSGTAADISGYVVVNGKTSLTIPSNTVIDPHGFLIVYCCGVARGGLFAPFTLAKSGGETLVLKNRDGIQLDAVKTTAAESNKSMAYIEGEWKISDQSTPGYPNDEEGYLALIESRKSASASDIVINEFMAANELTIADEDGEYSDWIEVRNTGTASVNLRNYSLSDDESAPYKWQFPDMTLGAGECALVFASEKDRTKKELHTDFKLKASGGVVMLSSSNGKILDTVYYDSLAKSCAYARDADGNFAKTYEPTPGFENSDYSGFYSYSDTNKKTLVINEAMSKNSSYLKQNGGKYYDWVELKNISEDDVSLKDFYLSSNSDEPAMWQLPDVLLGPGELYVVVASGSEILSNSAYVHSNFKINDEEQIFLYSSAGELIDGMCLKATPIDYSLGRVSGESGLFYIASPTPGAENNSGVRSVTSEPVINTDSGVYNGVESVKVSVSGEGTLYYTLDGSEPTKSSTLYTGEISLTSTSILRVAAYADNKLKSKSVSRSYIINENNSLPVMSMIIDPVDMYGYETGIYVKGPGASSEFPYNGANFWQDWEKTGQIDFFEDGRNGFSIPCGIKIFGQYSRGEDKKSFQLKFRDMYGESVLRYKLFDELDDISEFNDLVLRSGSQDWDVAMMRDEFLTSLAQSAENTTLFTQAYKPCVLYINGDYFGVYYIREKVNAEYVSQHLNVDPDSVTLLQANYTPIHGSNSEYKELLEYVMTHDMSNPDYYNYVAERIDVDNYIDYNIARMFSADQDTGNIKFFKSTDGDGKWRWIYYDLDWAFYYNTSISFYIREEGRPGFRYIYTFIYNLLKNDTFRDKFLTRFSYLMKTTYSAENIAKKIDSMADDIRSEMERTTERWERSFSAWEKNVNRLKERACARAEFLIEDIRSSLNMSSEEYNKYFGG